LVVGRGEYGLRLRGGRGEYDRRQQVQVLHARRGDPFHLTLRVELDRTAERHLVGDVGLADRFGERLRVGRAGALERVGGDEDRLEGEADVQSVEVEPVFRILLEE